MFIEREVTRLVQYSIKHAQYQSTMKRSHNINYKSKTKKKKKKIRQEKLKQLCTQMLGRHRAANAACGIIFLLSSMLPTSCMCIQALCIAMVYAMAYSL